MSVLKPNLLVWKIFEFCLRNSWKKAVFIFLKGEGRLMYRSDAVVFLLSSVYNFHGENMYVSG